ncbi:antibiotic biosynthesis monooxygenase [Bowmanella dokdonensis]
MEQGQTMYGLIGKIKALPGKREPLIDLLLEGSEMPGCLSYVVARDPIEPDNLWITEVWDCQESRQASLSLPVVQQTMEKSQALIAGFEQHVQTRPVGGQGLAHSG